MDEKFRPLWPGPAESRMNYYALLEDGPPNFGGRADGLRVAIIGAGIAGLTAAYQLLRAGVHRITLFEASNRTGGRLWSEPAPEPQNRYDSQGGHAKYKASGGSFAPYELGAMRMPLFTGKDNPNQNNSALKFFVKQFGIDYDPFPSPGSNHCDTGIWINDGYGPLLDEPYRDLKGRPARRLDIWRRHDDAPPKAYFEIWRKWDSFATMFRKIAKEEYAAADNSGGDERWWTFWRAVVSTYWQMNFRDLVFAPRKSAYTTPGDFGGLGMDESEAQVFYAIGMGDGGWGAFYDVSALWVIRTLLFGFGDELKLVLGARRDSAILENSRKLSFPAIPKLDFVGIESLADFMLMHPVFNHGKKKKSMMQLTRIESTEFELMLQSRVVEVQMNANNEHPLTIWYEELDWDEKTLAVKQRSEHPLKHNEFDAAIVTTPTWVGGMTITFTGFEGGEIRRFASPALNRSHVISSCKVFYPLVQRFWDDPVTKNGHPLRPIPQVISTDTFVQGMYGYAYGSHDPGVLLASYTWEDDALKLLGSDPRDLGERCLRQLDYIVKEALGSAYGNISDYVACDSNGKRLAPRLIQWAEQPSYIGCAKLYRQRSWHYDYELLQFNRLHGNSTHVYFAGEAYSVEGGWTEPALRSAIDAVEILASDSTGKSRLPDLPKWCPACVEPPGSIYPDSNCIWYAAYGSNLDNKHLSKYIAKCKSKAPPLEMLVRAISNRRLCFEGPFYTQEWGETARAFIKESEGSKVYCRLYLISYEQLKTIIRLANFRTSDAEITFPTIEALTEARKPGGLPLGSDDKDLIYDRIVAIPVDDFNVYTFTRSSLRSTDTDPAAEYLEFIASALLEVSPDFNGEDFGEPYTTTLRPYLDRVRNEKGRSK
jgi:tryptophan 2-monooxygenase